MLKNRKMPTLATSVLVLIAGVMSYLLYCRYIAMPWTRDAQVRADVVLLTPRVSGNLVEMKVRENQAVTKGQLLFQIDREPYELALAQAQVQLQRAHETARASEASLAAAESMIQQRKSGIKSAEDEVALAKIAIEVAESTVTEAQAGVAQAQAMIAATQARVDEAKREATRARNLANSSAGSKEQAEAREAESRAQDADLLSARARLASAEASLQKSMAGKSQAATQLTSAISALAQAKSAQDTAVANRDQAAAVLGERGDANVNVRDAQVALEKAQLNLRWTQIVAPADGYISNLKLHEEAFLAEGHPFALFVDSSSFYVEAYFQETKIRHMSQGDPVVVTVMGHTHRKLKGTIDSFGYAINPPRVASTDGSQNLVPTIAPTFEWIRLAQRIPVRIRLDEIPDDLHLSSGMTASVAVRKP